MPVVLVDLGKEVVELECRYGVQPFSRGHWAQAKDCAATALAFAKAVASRNVPVVGPDEYGLDAVNDGISSRDAP